MVGMLVVLLGLAGLGKGTLMVQAQPHKLGGGGYWRSGFNSSGKISVSQRHTFVILLVLFFSF